MGAGHNVPQVSKAQTPHDQKGWNMRAEDLIMLLLIFAIMYFLLIRPQQKKLKQHATMLEGLRRGDQIITQGGVVGKIVKVKEDDSNEVEVEIAKDVKVRVVKSTIATVINKTEPAKT
ncbi:preprotein translocase, YajC subunit [Roseobacter sp. CCS2]|nr:preprotein translocase, YajC subunit [Roseobacter sp. CCS2]